MQAMIENAARPGAGRMAALFGLVTLLIGATSALAELKDGLDEIWDAPPEKMRGFWYFVRKRLLSFGLILALGFLLLVSLVLSAVLAALSKFWGPTGCHGLRADAARRLEFPVVLRAGHRALRDDLQDPARGAHRLARRASSAPLVTALLFSIGKFLIGMYIGNSAMASTYGAAGSVILVLVWVYYSAQIFLLGAEFTKVYAHRYGSRSAARLSHN